MCSARFFPQGEIKRMLLKTSDLQHNPPADQDTLLGLSQVFLLFISYFCPPRAPYTHRRFSGIRQRLVTRPAIKKNLSARLFASEYVKSRRTHRFPNPLFSESFDSKKKIEEDSFELLSKKGLLVDRGANLPLAPLSHKRSCPPTQCLLSCR